MKRSVYSSFLALVITLTTASAVSAQDATPTPVDLENELPEGSVIGTGWFLDEVRDVGPLEGTDMDHHIAWYSGPQGSRIFLQVLDYGGSISGALAAFEYAKEAIDAIWWDLNSTSTSLSSYEIDGLDNLDVCTDMRRSEGLEAITRYPVGASACLHEESGHVLIVVVSGYVREGNSSLRYHDASDYVVTAILEDL